MTDLFSSINVNFLNTRVVRILKHRWRFFVFYITLKVRLIKIIRFIFIAFYDSFVAYTILYLISHLRCIAVFFFARCIVEIDISLRKVLFANTP